MPLSNTFFLLSERVCRNNMDNPDIGRWTFTSPTNPQAKRVGERTATLQCPSGFSPYPAGKRTLNCSDQVRWPEQASRPRCGELCLCTVCIHGVFRGSPGDNIFETFLSCLND